jgi:hypothetical protein
MKQQIYPQEWLAIPTRSREKLAELLSVPKSGGTIMQDNTMLSDGRSMKDLAVINVETMSKLVNSEETDFYKLLEACVKYANEKLEESIKKEVINTRELSIKRIKNTLEELKLEATRLGVFDEIDWFIVRKVQSEPEKQEVKEIKKRIKS